MVDITDVRFEHYQPQYTLGVQETKPRISWRVGNAPADFEQASYEIELSDHSLDSKSTLLCTTKVASSQTHLVPWPYNKALVSRQRISARVRAWNKNEQATQWSKPAYFEVGLLDRNDWKCQRIAAPWVPSENSPEPEQLYQKKFSNKSPVATARLYITSQGVYEAEINGRRVGDYFMAPGWTSYDGRIQYQTYDVTRMLSASENCLGVRLAEGWFCGRIGFEGGRRNIWGPQPALLAQLEITYTDGTAEVIASNGSWKVTKGPIRLAEIYDGEKYDATKEVPNWSSPSYEEQGDVVQWENALVLPELPASIDLTAGYGEPVRRVEALKPVELITTPSGKTILDFGQNLVGYTKFSNVRGTRGHKIILSHAEVLEKGELGTRPLRECKAIDEYILKGDEDGEAYEPRFTFHGFRYAQVDGWPVGSDLMASVEAVVCHTDMESVGSFSCSEPLLNQLYQNICWGMRGNFLSIPTDCPQRDERLGWTGDLALFAPTASLIYNCHGILKNWFLDVAFDQAALQGIPPMVSPNVLQNHFLWGVNWPCAIWHDVTILGPWALYEETGDKSILAQQYDSMKTWMSKIPRNKDFSTHLWDTSIFQLGDWLDPAASPHEPWKAATDAHLVANAFLVRCTDIMGQIAEILGKPADRTHFTEEAKAARNEFQHEYVTESGRVLSDSQTAYSLAICFDLLLPSQRARAGKRLAEIVRKNNFRIGTGFAGTPFVTEALAATGYEQVAYSMLLAQECPSWLYPVSMGATTVWERWDSMLPDGSINPGEMTSFNHYAFGAVAKFLYERIAGLQRINPGWTRSRVAPLIGANFSKAAASHMTPFGRLACSWEIEQGSSATRKFRLQLSVPPTINVEVLLPDGSGERIENVGAGDWTFETKISKSYEWPVKPIKPLPI